MGTQRSSVPGRGHTSGVKPLSNEPDAGHVQTRLDGQTRERALLRGSWRNDERRLRANANEHGDDGLFQVHRCRRKLRRLVSRRTTLRAAVRSLFCAAASALHLYHPRIAVPYIAHRPGREAEAKSEKKEQAEEH